MYCIEVKSKTDAKEIRDTIKKFERIKTLRFLTGKTSEQFEPYYTSGRQVHWVLFAFESDLKEKTELDRYKELDSNYKIDPAIDIICVVGKCYHCFNYQRGSWAIPETPAENLNEVLLFLTGLLNTLPEARRRPIIAFGYYLWDSKEGIYEP